MIGRLITNAMMPKQVSIVIATFTQNQNASSTRSYRFAPKLKPHTGWKPWPKPISAELINIINLETIDIAAIAESPNGPAAKFRITVATLASPWRQKEGSPACRISPYIFPVGVNLDSLIRMLPSLKLHW